MVEKNLKIQKIPKNQVRKKGNSSLKVSLIIKIPNESLDFCTTEIKQAIRESISVAKVIIFFCL